MQNIEHLLTLLVMFIWAEEGVVIKVQGKMLIFYKISLILGKAILAVLHTWENWRTFYF